MMMAILHQKKENEEKRGRGKLKADSASIALPNEDEDSDEAAEDNDGDSDCDGRMDGKLVVISMSCSEHGGTGWRSCGPSTTLSFFQSFLCPVMNAASL